MGTNFNVDYVKKICCDKCKGEGGFNAVMCNTCQGAGMRLQTTQNGPYMMQQAVPCGPCEGRGKIYSEKCECNNGLKYIDSNYELTVEPNMPILTTIQVRNAGHQEFPNLPPGNLIVSLGIDTQGFEIDRNGTVYFTKDISLDDWYNGETVEINRFDIENLSYNLSNLQKSDDLISFKNKGFKGQNHNQGDYCLKFRIVR